VLLLNSGLNERSREMVKQTDVVVAEKREQSPTEMIRYAIEKGADLDKLEKLMSLKREWDKDEARKAYHKAMAAFKSDPPKIFKDKTVSFDTQKGNTSYKHATLGQVTELVSTALSKHGLSASWTTKQNGQVIVTCRITHELGHSEETSLAAPSDTSGSKNAIQAIGSTITYLERYSLLALTGLATYDQDDAGIASSEVEYINDKQVHKLRDLLIATGLEKKESKLMKYLGVESLEKLPAKDFQKAVAAIEASGKKKGASK